MRRLHWLLVLALVPLLAASGCKKEGDDDDDNTSPSPSPTVPMPGEGDRAYVFAPLTATEGGLTTVGGQDVYLTAVFTGTSTADVHFFLFSPDGQHLAAPLAVAGGLRAPLGRGRCLGGVDGD